MISKAIAYGLGIALAASLAGLGVQSYRLKAEQADHANTKSEFSDYRGKATSQALELSEKNRATEQELANAYAANEALAKQALDAILSAAATEQLAHRRVQDAARDAADAARTRCAAATTPGYSTPGPDPIGVLADVLGRADSRAGELAAVAQGSRIRGLNCEANYDAAREALNKGNPS